MGPRSAARARATASAPGSPGPPWAGRRDRERRQPSLLLLNLYMIYPPDSGAKVVIYNRLVELAKHFRITFCCLGEHARDAAAAGELGRFAEVIVARGGPRKRSLPGRAWSLLRDPCALEFADKLSAWFESEEMRQLAAGRRFDVVELHSSCWYRRSLRGASGLKVLVALNSELEYYAERARAAWRLYGPAAGLRAALDAFLVAVQERRAIARADAVVSLAPLGEDRRRRWFGDRPVLCNWGGIDLEYYRSPEPAAGDPAAPRPGPGPALVFVAALFVESAVEAASRFVSDALPAIAQAVPGVRFVLVGDHRGNATIERLVDEHREVEATGLVRDVRPYLRAADVVVAPIVGGSGVRYKIMEGLAAGKPVVATDKAAEGLGLVDGRDILLSPTVAGMAPLVLRILRDDALRRDLSRNGREAARDKFDRVVEHRRLADWYLGLLAAGDRQAQGAGE